MTASVHPLTVVKVGGDESLDLTAACRDVARLRATGEQVVVVHGGATAIARLAAELGVAERTLVSPAGIESRYTDDALLDVVVLAMTGRVKPRVVRELAGAGVRAVGLTGMDAGMVVARPKQARRAVVGGRTMLVRDDRSGRISRVDPTVLRVLLDAGLVPVVSPPAAGPDGAPLNVDGDRCAAAVAAALGAQRLVLLTAAPGLLADAADPGSVIARAALPDDSLLGHAVTSGMQRKLVAVQEALDGGVEQVHIADGRTDAPVTAALAGSGTVLVARRDPQPDREGMTHDAR